MALWARKVTKASKAIRAMRVLQGNKEDLDLPEDLDALVLRVKW